MSNLKNNQVLVLLIDDDEEDYLIIKRVFFQIPNSPYILNWCSSFEEAKKLIMSQAYDVYLIDYDLGEHTGLELLEFAEPMKRSEPFILMTGGGDSQIEKKSMKLGAVDYLVKGTFQAELLSRTLNYAIGRKDIEGQRLRQLIEINRTKDEFISLASHQLRTPATAVKQYVGMVLEGFVGNISESQRDILAKAYESNERQLNIVSELLKVARVDAGKVRLLTADVDLVRLLADTIKEQQRTYFGRSQRVEFVYSSAAVIAVVDKDKMRMVFENLLDNASKYSDAGKTVRVEVIDGAREVLIKIADQGVGIKKEDQIKLFEKFSRIHNHLSDQVGGTGLGLYWVKKIINLHQGRISFVSQYEVGTTFNVYLPKKRLAVILG
ncbi:MAG: ATP-binding protein [Candidatus Saccharibacteria bacterium]